MAVSLSAPRRLRSRRSLTEQPAELIIVFAPGGGHKFFEELGPATRTATFDRDEVAAIFERHGMTPLGPPLSAD